MLPEEQDESSVVEAPKKPMIQQMRKDLRDEYNFKGVDQLSIDEVEEAWLSYVLQREMEEMAGNVRFPVYDASAIDESDKWDVIMVIDFSNGGSFLLDPKLAEKYIPDTLELFAAFVYFGLTDQKRTTWQFDGAVYSTIPQMFIDFAQECRLDDSSYRLLRHCVWHTFDSRTGSLTTSLRS
jgi:hypothetical protein